MDSYLYQGNLIPEANYPALDKENVLSSQGIQVSYCIQNSEHPHSFNFQYFIILYVHCTLFSLLECHLEKLSSFKRLSYQYGSVQVKSLVSTFQYEKADFSGAGRLPCSISHLSDTPRIIFIVDITQSRVPGITNPPHIFSA